MQMSIFDGIQDFRFHKPIRLIEFFGGYGSQARALEELKKWGIKFEHWKLCEWAVNSIKAYKDHHFPNDNTDYSKTLSKEEIIDKLVKWGISQNYNNPMEEKQIRRMGEKTQREIFNCIVATHNLVNIQQVKGSSLDIVDTDKYDYVLTYSFPCQDLSKAGKQKGMAKDSGTRSGLLWEVERILDECNQIGTLPQILLMENVPDVIGQKNISHFASWLAKLEKLGYKCYWQVLNSKDYGIPQNRERCFMISILGDYWYGFPQTTPLENKLTNVLEQKVDERFYLSQKAIHGKLNTKFRTSSFDGCLPQEDGCCRTLCARDYKDPKCVVEPIACELRCDEGIRTFKDNIMGTLRTIDGCGDKHIIELNGNEYEITKDYENYIEFKREGRLDMNNRVWKNISPTLHTSCGETKIFEPTLKEQLCDKLCESGKLKVGDVINHSYTNGLTGKNPNSRQTLDDYIENTNGICNTLTTRPDVLGIAVEDLTTKNKRLANMVDKIDPTKCQAIDIYNQSVHEEMHTIRTNVDKGNMTAVTQNLRIRKLTPKECFRLMGIRDKDFERIARNQSKASLYHLAGDSIVVSVLVAIFGQFLDNFNFNDYIQDFYKEIKNG